MRFRLTTFGELALHATDGTAVAAPRRKPLALLAIVAAHEPDGIARERLLGLLWPESTPERARSTLSQTLYALRTDLQASPVTGTVTLHLDPEVVDADVLAFRRASEAGAVSEAARIARRPFLDGVAFAGCVEFDSWAEGVRAEFERLVAHAHLTRARAASRTGDPAAVEHWRRACLAMPLDSLVTREAARALASAGDRLAAVQLLQNHVTALVRELSARPDHETTALIDELRSPPDSAVEVERASSVRRPTPPGQAAAPDNRPAPAPLAMRPGRWRRARMIVVVPVVVAGVALAVTATLASRRAGGSDPSAVPRLLVAPFTYHGPVDRAYLGRGVAEEIATRMAPLPGLRLIAPSAMPGPDAESSSRAAQRLGAQFVLEGSVQSEGTGPEFRVRVAGRLVSVRDGNVLWSWIHDGQSSDVLALQAAIADSTARRIPIVLSAETSRRLHTLPTSSPEAFDFYLRAGEYLRRGREGLPQARELLGEALALDSNFALALARYGETQARMNWYGRDRDPRRMARARELIERAIAIDRFLPEGHLALGYWYLYDRRAYDLALAHMDTVLSLSRYHAEALAARGQIERRLGRWDNAVAGFAAALAVDQGSYAVQLELGNTLLLMRQFDRAREALERARALAPDAADPIAWLAALAVRSAGDTAQAAEILARGIEQVDARQLLARMMLTFPEVLRSIRRDPFAAVPAPTLQDAYGDTVSLHIMVARPWGPAPPPAMLAHLDSARSTLRAQLRETPDEYAIHRRLAEVSVMMGDPATALRHAREARDLMPVSRDAMSGAAALLSLAEAEVLAGAGDSALVHLRELLRVPSAASDAVVHVDPRWSGLRHSLAAPTPTRGHRQAGARASSPAYR